MCIVCDRSARSVHDKGDGVFPEGVPSFSQVGNELQAEYMEHVNGTNHHTKGSPVHGIPGVEVPRAGHAHGRDKMKATGLWKILTTISCPYQQITLRSPGLFDDARYACLIPLVMDGSPLFAATRPRKQ